MNTPDVPRAPVDETADAATDDVLWYHPALCGVALPHRPARGPWSRHAGASTVSLEPGTPDGLLPGGRLLRLLLLRVCDVAVRARGPLVPLGDDPSAWLAGSGLDPDAADLRDLPLQLLRLLDARLQVADGGGPAVAVFDARSRPRGGEAAWPSRVRLNGRFLQTLIEGAVPLRRDAVRRLWRAPDAFDAYAWAMGRLHRDGDAPRRFGWDDLRRRFGTPSRDAAAFRAAFGEALRSAGIATAEDDAHLVLRPDGHDPSPPSLVGGVTSPGDPAPSSGDSAPSPGDPDPSPDDPVASPGNPVPLPGGPVPASSDPAPASGDLVPSPGDPTPSFTDPVPSSSDPVPSPNDPIPSSSDPVPSPAEPVPSPGDLAPAPATTPAAVARTAPPVGVPDVPAAAGAGDRRPPATAAAAPAATSLPDPVSLPSRQTGVPGVLWLRHGHGAAFPLIGVTPGNRMDPERLTVLAVEPMVLQVEGGLSEREFAQVSSWIMSNRDLIDAVWEGRVASVEELGTRVQVVRGPGWR